MTRYIPSIPQSKKPYYVRIADAIETDIVNKNLHAGEKLPPMRNLAFDLRVTIGTISRSYRLLLERGLTNGEVGRGTFVCEHGEAGGPQTSLPNSWHSQNSITFPPINQSVDQEGNKQTIDLEGNGTPDIGQTEIIAKTIAENCEKSPLSTIDYAQLTTPKDWQQAGAHWISNSNWTPNPDNIVPTNGVDAALLSLASAITSPGDKIAFEAHTYGSFTRVASLIGRRPISVAMDGEGMIPEQFERVCAQEHPKLVYVMPELHTPTNATMSKERREAIARIAQKFNVWIVEDHVYTPLIEAPCAPIAAYAPELTFNLSGMSKTVSAALRVGWIACPDNYAHRIRLAHRTIDGTPSTIMHAAGAKLVLSGIAGEINARARELMAKRTKKLCDCLQGYDVKVMPTTSYAWLKLPDPLRSGQVYDALSKRGIYISTEDRFIVGRTEKLAHGVRIAYGAVRDETHFDHAIKIIRQVLDDGAVTMPNTR